MQWIYKDLRVIRDHNETTRAFFLLLLLLLLLTLQVREFKYSPLQHADYLHFTFTSRRKSHDRQIAVNNSGLATCYICHFLQFSNNPLFCLVGARTLWKRLSVYPIAA